MWRDKLFHIGNAIEYAVSCRANACGVTMLFVGRASGIGASKGAIKCNFLRGLILKYYFKKSENI